MKRKFVILSGFFLIFSLVLFAQDDVKKKKKDSLNQYTETGIIKGQKYVIIRFDGVEYIGEILSDDLREILVKTSTIGEVYIPKFEIKRIIPIQEEKVVVYDEFQDTGPFTTRYSFTTNAWPIKKGENYGMLNLYGPEAHIALTDHLNVGLMASWIASPIVLAAKYSFLAKESNLNFSAGTLIGTSGYLNNFKGYGGLHWLNATFGDRKNNVTLAGGYAYLQTGFEDAPNGTYIGHDTYDAARDNNPVMNNPIRGPIFSVACIFRIGAKSSFVFDSMFGYFTYDELVENSFWSDAYNNEVFVITRNTNNHTMALFLMPGVRFQNNDRKAFQLCIAGVSTFGDINESFPLPMVSWFYKF